MPVAIVENGTAVNQRVVDGQLTQLGELAQQMASPALIIVGRVVALREQLNWFSNHTQKNRDNPGFFILSPGQTTQRRVCPMLTACSRNQSLRTPPSASRKHARWPFCTLFHDLLQEGLIIAVAVIALRSSLSIPETASATSPFRWPYILPSKCFSSSGML